MKLLETPGNQLNLTRALREMTEALAVLDQLDVPAEVGSHLDLAICRLEQYLGLDAPPTDGAGALYAGLADELLSSGAISNSPWPMA